MPFKVSEHMTSSSEESSDRFYLHKQKIFPIQVWPAMVAKCLAKILLINSLGFKVIMVNSGIKHAFRYEKKTLIEFSMAVDSKKNT